MSVLYFFQSLRTPILDTLMQLITRFGEETVFMVAAIGVFWCVSKTDGYYLLSVGFLGTVLNQFLKLAFRIPRPWVRDPQFSIVESARAGADGYSFPSGHTQNAVATFGGIARFTRRRWVRGICIALAILVPISRMYLGVHTPLDVSVAFVTALVLVAVLYPVIDQTEKHPRMLTGLLAVLCVIAAGYVAYVSLHTFPADIDAANLASGTENAWKLLGATVGMLLGSCLERRFVHFETKAPFWVQCVKLVGGLALLVGIRAGLKGPFLALFGHAGLAGAARYLVMVVFAAAVWPMVFRPLCRAAERRVRRRSVTKGK